MSKPAGFSACKILHTTSIANKLCIHWQVIIILLLQKTKHFFHTTHELSMLEHVQYMLHYRKYNDYIATTCIRVAQFCSGLVQQLMIIGSLLFCVICYS